MERDDLLWNGTITITISGASDLAIADAKSSDPYCVTNVIHYFHKSESRLLGTHKTMVVDGNLNPHWNEKFSICIYKSKDPIIVQFTVWDKDTCLSDDFLGQLSVEITNPASCSFFGVQREEKLLPREKSKKKDVVIKGTLTYTVSYEPGVYKSPVPYKYHNHKFTGLARSMGAGESARIYGTYQVKMHNISQVFGDTWQPWNKLYESAQKIFESPLVRGTVTAQHNHLYSEISVTKKGELNSGEDLVNLLKAGVKGGKPRFFTYALKDDNWNFSETGASFFVDFTSKHAMHASVSESVRYAGEFHFQPNDDGTYRLVIDNNSGTYSPSKDALPLLKTAFEINFPGLIVEVLDYKDPLLKEYKNKLFTGGGGLGVSGGGV